MSLLFLLSIVGTAQNLVFNPGFEIHKPITCIGCDDIAPLTIMKGWKRLGYYMALHSTDYQYNRDEVEKGYTQEKYAPFAGKAVVCMPMYGLRGKHDPPGEAGYLWGVLQKPLEKGVIYAISFQVKIQKNFKEADFATLDFLKNFGVSFSDKDFSTVTPTRLLVVNDSPFTLQEIAVGKWVQVKYYIRPTRPLDRILAGWMQNPAHFADLSENKKVEHFEFLLDNVTVELVQQPDEAIVQQAIDYPFLLKPEPEPLPQPVASFTPATIHFDFATATLTAVSKKTLDSLAQQILQIKQGVFEITGHTDSIRGDNATLSVQRAEAVKSYLVQKTGLPAYQFVTSGKGSNEAAAANETKKGRQLNRRVTIRKSDLEISVFLYQKASYAALAGQKDTAFHYLRLWQTCPETDQMLLLHDPDLLSLQSDKAWQAVVYFAKQSYKKYRNSDLAWQLADLSCKDQRFRGLKDDYKRAKGYIPKALDLPFLESLEKIAAENKTSNDQLETVAKILKNGWPDPAATSKRLSEVPIQVIVHSENPVIQKKWLPTVERAFKEKKLEGNGYAQVFDAMLKKEKGLQRYGSNYFPNPNDPYEYSVGTLENEANLDSLRASVGLPPLTIRTFRVEGH